MHHRVLDAFELLNFSVDFPDVLHRQSFNVGARPGLILPKGQEFLDVINREAEISRALNELERAYVLLVKRPVTIGGTRGGGQYANAFVETYGLCRHPGFYRGFLYSHLSLSSQIDLLNRKTTLTVGGQPFYSDTRFSRNALLMTETELKLIAAAAIIGLNRIPKAG